MKLFLIYVFFVSIFSFNTFALSCLPVAEIKRDTIRIEPRTIPAKKGRIWNRLDKRDVPFALVLSGGGSRGISQIGVLDILDSCGFTPSLIVGVSMGAVIGGLYSAGYSPKELENIARSIDWNRLITDRPERTSLFQTQRIAMERFIFQIRFTGLKPDFPEAVSAAQIMTNYISMLCAPAYYFSNGDFDKLKVPLRCIATDLKTGKSIVFKKGNLATAIRASSAVPLLLSPVKTDSSILADGGLIFPIPVEIALDEGFDRVIAVDATAEIEYYQELDNALFIIDQTTNIMAEEKKKRERELADIVISPNLTGFGSFDFSDIDSLIERGRVSARQAIPAIDSVLKREKENRKEKPLIIASVKGMDFGEIDLVPGITTTVGAIEKKIDELYSRGIYGKIACSIIESADSISLEFDIEKNPNLTAIEYTGINLFPIDSLLRVFEIEVGKTANLALIDSLFGRLEEIYRDSGYSLAHVESAFFENGVLGFVFDEGLVERIDISGNLKTKDWVIRELIPLSPGENFRGDKISEALRDLHATDLFASVTPEISRGERGAIISFKVIEKPYLSAKLGIRYDLVFRMEGAFEFGNDNLWGSALRLNVGTAGGESRWEFYARIGADRLWRTFLTSQLGLFVNGKEFDLWEADTIVEKQVVNDYGFSISLGQQIKRLGTVSAELSTERVAFGKQGRPLREYPLHKLTLRSLVDTFDDRQFPRSGKYHESYFSMSKDILGGEYSFTKSFASFQSYWSIGEHLTYRPYILGGYIAGGPPFFEYFEIGEMTDFFGFRGDERRGVAIAKTGLDFRINSMEPVYVDFGLTVGRVWQKDSALELEDLIWGWGAGWGIATPIGPIMLRWGRNTEKREEIKFSIGYDFD